MALKNIYYDKKYLLLLLFTIIAIGLHAQSTYYYYNNKQIPLSPNPASEQISVSYQLAPNIPQAQLQIVNTMGTAVKTQTINNQNNNTTLSVQNLIAGQYAVRLISPTGGGILDSKTLIIQ